MFEGEPRRQLRHEFILPKDPEAIARLRRIGEVFREQLGIPLNTRVNHSQCVEVLTGMCKEFEAKMGDWIGSGSPVALEEDYLHLCHFIRCECDQAQLDNAAAAEGLLDQEGDAGIVNATLVNNSIVFDPSLFEGEVPQDWGEKDDEFFIGESPDDGDEEMPLGYEEIPKHWESLPPGLEREFCKRVAATGLMFVDGVTQNRDDLIQDAFEEFHKLEDAIIAADFSMDILDLFGTLREAMARLE